MEDVSVARPWSIMSSTNDRFIHLECGQLVQFRNAFACKNSDQWIDGILSKDTSHGKFDIPGEAVIDSDNCNGETWFICVNDSRCFRVKK